MACGPSQRHLLLDMVALPARRVWPTVVTASGLIVSTISAVCLAVRASTLYTAWSLIAERIAVEGIIAGTCNIADFGWGGGGHL